MPLVSSPRSQFAAATILRHRALSPAIPFAIAAIAGCILLPSQAAYGATFTTVYTWPNGEAPGGGLTRIGDLLYGTTVGYGEAPNFGTVFSFNPTTGVETTLYGFPYAGDGTPSGGVIYKRGFLYGATRGSLSPDCYNGGSGSCGAVFKVNSTSGAETTLHEFTGGGNDGAQPTGGLVKIGNFLYGTTFRGGVSGGSPLNYGTLFQINAKTGAEKTIYSFTGGKDGANPNGELIEVGGLLFGTASGGGLSGFGTVFALNPATGAETTIYTFTGSDDGANPLSGVTRVDGFLYGATTAGGGGDGTVFKIDYTTGAFATLYTFGVGGYHGALTNVGGFLYGSTDEGGASGCGTIFKISRATGAATVLYNLPSGYCNEGPLSTLLSFGNVFFGETPSSLFKFTP